MWVPEGCLATFLNQVFRKPVLLWHVLAASLICLHCFLGRTEPVFPAPQVCPLLLSVRICQCLWPKCLISFNTYPCTEQFILLSYILEPSGSITLFGPLRNPVQIMHCNEGLIWVRCFHMFKPTTYRRLGNGIQLFSVRDKLLNSLNFWEVGIFAFSNLYYAWDTVLEVSLGNGWMRAWKLVYWGYPNDFLLTDLFLI